MRAELTVRGPSVVLLAQYLAEHQGWTIESAEQSSFFGGTIIGDHLSPMSQKALGISDGTYAAYVRLLESQDDGKNTD